jgi:hypothetical protein
MPTKQDDAAEASAPEGFYWMTVLKNGDGHIHTGREDGPPGESFKRNDRFLASLDTARSLEKRGLAEADADLPADEGSV